MWEWIVANTRKAVQALPCTPKKQIEVDDVVSNVLLVLSKDPQLAENIYEQKSIGTIYTIAKKEAYDIESKMYFDRKMDFSRYKRIIDVCDKYGIEPIAENAYKISEMIGNGSVRINISDFTIGRIISVLSQKKNNDYVIEENYSF